MFAWAKRVVLAAILWSSGSLVRAVPSTLSDSRAAEGENVLATLGEAEIRQSEFDDFLEDGYSTTEIAKIHQNAALDGEALRAYLDLRVLAAKARKDQIDRTPAFEKARELMAMKLLVKGLADRDRDRIAADTPATPTEIIGFYNEHKDRFLRTPGFTARHILIYVKGNPAFPDKGLDEVGAEAQAQEALAKLRAGETWESVATHYSDDSATNRRGGLIEDTQFGFYPAEMEAAVRRQELGKPGNIIKSPFGYHILEVEKRTLEREYEPFDKVKDTIEREISAEKRAIARRKYINQLRSEISLKETEAATREAPPNGPAIDPNEVLATLAGTDIREKDFQWFIKDAYRPEQRAFALSRRGARRELLTAYLEMRLMEAKARNEGIDHETWFDRTQTLMEMKLLAEFLCERDKISPWRLHGVTDEARNAVLEDYTNRLRAEMGLKIRTTN